MNLKDVKKKQIIMALQDLGYEEEVTRQAANNEAGPFMVDPGDKVAIYYEKGETSFYLVGVIDTDVHGLFNMKTGVRFSGPIKEPAPFDVRKIVKQEGWVFDVIVKD